MEVQISFCRENQYVETMFGRKCFIRGIKDKNFAIRGFSERQSINAPIQGSAADVMRIAMIKIKEAFDNNSNYKAKILLQIHDELVFEVFKNELKKIVPIIKQNMSDVSSSEHHIFSIPLTVDINSGNNWGEAH